MMFGNACRGNMENLKSVSSLGGHCLTDYTEIRLAKMYLDVSALRWVGRHERDFVKKVPLCNPKCKTTYSKLKEKKRFNIWYCNEEGKEICQNVICWVRRHKKM